ncbi:hypothetical protein BDQ17DRAFT_1309221 [Cyathus striatus]|nr:hypothetical protein BDQ17DRAFT_1309221 [Cyathus striatus]
MKGAVCHPPSYKYGAKAAPQTDDMAHTYLVWRRSGETNRMSWWCCVVLHCCRGEKHNTSLLRYYPRNRVYLIPIPSFASVHFSNKLRLSSSNPNNLTFDSRFHNYLIRSHSINTHALYVLPSLLSLGSATHTTAEHYHCTNDNESHQHCRSLSFDQLVAAEVPLPELRPTDILVNAKAVSVNPVEAKIRYAFSPFPPTTYSLTRSILGFHYASTVSSLGSQVPAGTFAMGEEVWLLGSTVPARSNAEYIAVDYRVVAPRSKILSFKDATAVLLVGFTAWETTDQTGMGNEPGTLLVIKGVGGVGSGGIQLAKAKGVKNIIATASRDARFVFSFFMIAQHTINHRELLKPQIEALNLSEPIEYIPVFTNLIKSVLDQEVDVVAP